MPTARPIIIEKFIDHTDIGVIQPSRCRSAKPTAMPASASTQREPGGDAACRTRRTAGSGSGRPLTQLGLVERFGVDLVEVAPHRPLAGDLGVRAGRERQLADVAAELRRRRPDGRASLRHRSGRPG